MPAAAHRGKGRRTKNEINMVPFIDVMLVLLIIFMVTAPLITPSQIELPSVGQAARQPDRFIQVVIDKDTQYRVKEGSASGDGDIVEVKLLAEKVRALQGPSTAEPSSVPVIISADKNVKYEAVVQAMDTLQRAGIQRVGLSVQSSR